MNFQKYVTSTTASLFWVAISYLGDAGSVSPCGHLCLAVMKVVFKCRKKGTPALAFVDLQTKHEWRQRQLLGMNRHLFFCLSS